MWCGRWSPRSRSAAPSRNIPPRLAHSRCTAMTGNIRHAQATHFLENTCMSWSHRDTTVGVWGPGTRHNQRPGTRYSYAWSYE